MLKTMFRILFRLYLVTIVSFSAAIYLVPDLVIKVFHERFVSYNLDYSRGLQTLMVKQFRAVPHEQWPALAAEMDKEFEPLHIVLSGNDDAGFSVEEQQRLQRGENVVRVGDWGWRTLAVAPLDERTVVQMIVPPDPIDVSLLYWSINVLIGATMLACLLLWLRPHWRDLERLKRAAERFGKGHLGERTQIAASSNIGSLANVFDTMAGDIENLLNQQRDLLNAVSHELRTPLTRLDFGLALALSDDLPATSRERLQGLVDHIRELDELVLELLSYSRLQNPARLPERVEVSLDEFIDSILGSVDEELDTPQIVIDVLLHGQLERFSLDPRLTARAIQNLLRNAMRYCEKRIQIGVQVCPKGCEIWVDDDGIGIPEDERERIFEPFYRLDRSRDRATGGFGLGLAISRRALEAQGGALTVEASPLGGARFRLWLPTPV
jgi:two-component system OmpR family sensor kinase